jgi:hypothetical protein
MFSWLCRLYSVEWEGNSEWSGRDVKGNSHLVYCKVSGETEENHRKPARISSQASNLGPLKYDAAVLTTWLQHLIRGYCKINCFSSIKKGISTSNISLNLTCRIIWSSWQIWVLYKACPADHRTLSMSRHAGTDLQNVCWRQVSTGPR